MRSNPNCNGNRRDKVALKTTRVKNVKFNIVKRSTGCQYAGYFYESKNLTGQYNTLHWAAGWS